MKTKLRRTLSLVLTICLCFTMLPVMTLQAEASALSQSQFDEKLSSARALYPTGSRKEEWSINGAVVGWQCHGYGRWLSWYVWGVDFANGTGTGWTLLKSSSSSSYINSLVPGDVVRYRRISSSGVLKNWNHTIFITKIIGDTIYYTDCNSDGACTIVWEQQLSKATLDSWLKLPLYGNEAASYGYIAHYTPNSLGAESDRTVDPNYSSFLPIDTYAISTGRITVYNSAGVEYNNRYIDGSTDLCTILEIYTDGWCKVKYPSSAESSGYFTAYVNLSEFIPNASPTGWTANKNADAYRRSSGTDTIGSVSAGDNCLKVSSDNGRIQVIYPVTGKGYFKMGWVNDDPESPTDPTVPTVFYQADSRWGTHPYGSGPNGPATIGSAGCGLLSYVNAVYSLTGNFIEPTFLADWSVNNGHRVDGVGTSHTLYPEFASAYGATYGFEYEGQHSSYSTLANYLQNGCVAIFSVPNHLMACVYYDAASGTYLVLDSDPRASRGTSSGYAWKTESQMNDMGASINSYFYVLRRSGQVPPPVPTGFLLPCYSYPISTGQISVYDSNHNQYSNRYITGSTDQCIIRELYTDGWCYVSYPSTAESDGWFEAYVPTMEFISNPNPVSWTANANYTAYRRSSGSETIGSINNGDQCVVVDQANGRMQVMYPVTGTNYYKMGWIDAALWNNPVGAFDFMEGGVYRVRVTGWAFDRDDLNANLRIHIYVGDKCYEITANAPRSDVNAAYGCGDYHGYDAWIDVDRNLTGSQKVEVYAINVGGGDNVLLGSGTVDIGSDTTGPVISNVSVSDISSDGYTVTCTVTDENGVDRVQFPSWTTHNGQNDLFENWEVNSAASGTKDGDTYTYRVYTSAHNYEGGEYVTHIYAYDKYGNPTKYEVPVVQVPIDVISVELNYLELFFNKTGETQTLTATICPENATDRTLVWASSDTSVATVANGVVTAVGNGTAVITATAGNGVYAMCHVTVAEVVQESVKITTQPTKTVYYVGETLDTTGLTLTATFSDGSTQIITDGFTCSPTILSTVGTQTITVSYGGKTTTFEVTVRELPTGAMSVSKVSGTPGETVTVSIRLDSNPGVIAARLKIAYDSNALTLVEVKDGGILGESLFGVDMTANPYILTWENGLATSDYTATGTLVYLTFKIAENAPVGELPITVSYDPEEIYNKDQTNVAFTITQGAITIEESEEVDPNTPKIVFASQAVTSGQTIAVEITAVNMPEVISLMLENFQYDSDMLEFVGAELNLENAVIADWDNADMIATVAFTENTDINGTILTLTFKVKDGVEGECSITCDVYANQMQADGNETQVELSVISGTITVMSYQRGDVNGDDYVNSKDAIYLLRYTLTPNRYPINQDGDMNGDGYVNSKDAIYLLRHTLTPSRYPLH